MPVVPGHVVGVHEVGWKAMPYFDAIQWKLDNARSQTNNMSQRIPRAIGRRSDCQSTLMVNGFYGRACASKCGQGCLHKQCQYITFIGRYFLADNHIEMVTQPEGVLLGSIPTCCRVVVSNCNHA